MNSFDEEKSKTDLLKLSDGVKDASGRVWISPYNHSGQEQVMGFLYDLGGYYAISGVEATFPAQDAKKQYAKKLTVYGGSKNDESILENPIVSAENPDNSASMAADVAEPGDAVRYILVVFDDVPTQAGNPDLPADMDPSMDYGCLYITELEVFGTPGEEPSTDEPVLNVLKDVKDTQGGALVPQTVKLPKPAPYTSFSEVRLLSSGNNGNNFADPSTDELNKADLLKLNDGDKEAATSRVWITLPSHGGRENVMGFLYDLGGFYEIRGVAAAFPAQDAAKGFAKKLTVYGGAKNDESILENPIVSAENPDNSASMSADAAEPGDAVRYILVVFDDVPTQANVQGAWDDGALYITELEVFGVKGEKPLGENILRGNQNASVIHIAREMSWTDSLPYTYDPSAYSVYQESMLDSQGKIAWTDGDLETRAGAGGAYMVNNPNMLTTRAGVLYDLGGFYDLNQVEFYISDKDANTDKRYILGVSVYAGPVADSSILNNRIGYGGGKTDHLSVEVSTTESVRYILFMFDRMGTDTWCTEKHVAATHPATCVPVEGAEKYCVYSDGGIFLTELEVYGTEGANPTQEFSAKDTATGLEIQVVTHDNDVAVEGYKLTKLELTPAQEKMVEELEVEAPNGLYHIDLLDAQGNVITDMSGRQMTLRKLVDGEEYFAYYTPDTGIVIYDAPIDLETGYMTWIFEEGSAYFDILVLDAGDGYLPDYSGEEEEPDGAADSGDEDIPDTGAAFPAAVLGLAGAAAAALVAVSGNAAAETILV